MTMLLIGFCVGVLAAGLIVTLIVLLSREKPAAAPRPKRRRGLVEMELTARGLLMGTRNATLTLTVEEVERSGDLVRVDIVDMAGYSGVTLGQVRWVAPKWVPDNQIEWLDPASDSSS